jgi:hypothetical protein
MEECLAHEKEKIVRVVAFRLVKTTDGLALRQEMPELALKHSRTLKSVGVCSNRTQGVADQVRSDLRRHANRLVYKNVRFVS